MKTRLLHTSRVALDDSLQEIPLPEGIRSTYLDRINGLHVHVLEAGFESAGRPALLLLHGFPELAFSWRRIMPLLAKAGYHVIAPDQRGYGRTTGWDAHYDGDLSQFRILNLVRDALGIVDAMGYRTVDAVIGHDFGSPVAAWCALLRPDVFRSVVLMSAPFAGAPALAELLPWRNDPVLRELASLPRPRKHYFEYYSSRVADEEMSAPSDGRHAFLRAYYHAKSADVHDTEPHRLSSWSPRELAKLPDYYVMDLEKSMPQTVAQRMPTPAEVTANAWLPEDDLAFYVSEFARTHFQGGLQWYRCATAGRFDAELQIWSGRTIDVPSVYIAGRRDWGTYQRPGAFESMWSHACTAMRSPHLIEGAGHWVQQERPVEVTAALIEFLGKRERADVK